MRQKILVFDSGLGGLSILNEISRLNLDVEIDYLADNAFFPYGAKSDLELLDRIPKIVAKGIEKSGAKAAIIACNTASTIALYRIRQISNIPIIGVVPAIKPACLISKTKTIGVLATPRTIGTAYFDQLIEDFAQDCRVIRYGPPKLANAAEEFLLTNQLDENAVRDAIDGLMTQNGGEDIDTIVLACTHYPFLRTPMAESISRTINWIDSGNAIARRLGEVLSLGRSIGAVKSSFYLSGEIDETHRKIAKSFGFHKVANEL